MSCSGSLWDHCCLAVSPCGSLLDYCGLLWIVVARCGVVVACCGSLLGRRGSLWIVPVLVTTLQTGMNSDWDECV